MNTIVTMHYIDHKPKVEGDALVTYSCTICGNKSMESAITKTGVSISSCKQSKFTVIFKTHNSNKKIPKSSVFARECMPMLSFKNTIK